MQRSGIAPNQRTAVVWNGKNDQEGLGPKEFGNIHERKPESHTGRRWEINAIRKSRAQCQKAEIMPTEKEASANAYERSVRRISTEDETAEGGEEDFCRAPKMDLRI